MGGQEGTCLASWPSLKGVLGVHGRDYTCVLQLTVAVIETSVEALLSKIVVVGGVVAARVFVDGKD